MARTPTRNILFKFLGDQKSLERATKKTTKNLGSVQTKARGASKSVGLLQGGLAKLGGLLAAGVLIKGLKDAVLRAQEMESQYAITATVIESTGGAANLTAAEVKAMSREMALTTGIDKVVATEAANILLTFKELRNEVGLGNDAFARAHKLTADMAVVFKGSASDAAKTLGKALNAPIEGLSALRRVGVTFTEKQKEVIRSLVETGDILGAQKIILEELESQVGGTAEASADATKVMGAVWQEFAELLGQKLLPALDDSSAGFIRVLDASGDFFRNVGLGAQGIEKLVSRYGDLMTLGLTDFWDDADEALFKFTKTSEWANQLVKDGSDATKVAGEWMANLAIQQALTADTTARIAAELGLSNDQMVDAALFAIANADALGLTADQIAILKSSYMDLNPLVDEGIILTGAYARSLHEAAEGGMAAATAADDAAQAVKELAEENRKLVDPVFRAKKAQEKFNKVLLEVREDGIVTREELDKLTAAHLELQAATDAISPENMEAYRNAVTEVRQNVVSDVEIINTAISSIGAEDNLANFKEFLDRLSVLVNTPIQVNIGMDLTTPAALERSILRVIQGLQRRGEFVQVPT